MIRDHKRAAFYMRISIFGMALASGILQATGDFTLPGLGLIFYYLFSKSWTSIANFEVDPSVQNAKQLKRGVYTPFTIFFLTLVLSIIGLTPEKLYKKYTKENKE